jgi:hypothetical protein
MAEIRNYSYDASFTPSWQSTTFTGFSNVSPLQSYTTLQIDASTTNSDASAISFLNSSFPATNYRGNVRVQLAGDGQNYYALRVHKDVVNSVFNGSSVYKVLFGANTVFHRQIAYGQANTAIQQVSRTTSSITWRVYNNDTELSSVNVFTSLNNTSYNIPQGTLGPNSNKTVTSSGLASGTSYTLNHRNSRDDINILPSEPRSNQWSTLTPNKFWSVLGVTFSPNSYSFSLDYSYQDGGFGFGCPSTFTVRDNVLPNPNNYTTGTRARVTVFDSEFSFCGYYWYQVAE